MFSAIIANSNLPKSGGGVRAPLNRTDLNEKSKLAINTIAGVVLVATPHLIDMNQIVSYTLTGIGVAHFYPLMKHIVKSVIEYISS